MCMLKSIPREVPMKAVQAAYRGSYDALRLVDIPGRGPGPAWRAAANWS